MHRMVHGASKGLTLKFNYVIVALFIFIHFNLKLMMEI